MANCRSNTIISLNDERGSSSNIKPLSLNTSELLILLKMPEF